MEYSQKLIERYGIACLNKWRNVQKNCIELAKKEKFRKRKITERFLEKLTKQDTLILFREGGKALFVDRADKEGRRKAWRLEEIYALQSYVLNSKVTLENILEYPNEDFLITEVRLEERIVDGVKINVLVLSAEQLTSRPLRQPSTRNNIECYTCFVKKDLNAES